MEERERGRKEKIKERMRTESEMDRFARNAAWKAWNTSDGGGGAVRLSNEEGFSVLTKKQKQMRREYIAGNDGEKGG